MSLGLLSPANELTVRPCSVHDPEQAIVYAKKLHEYAQEAKDDLVIVMRVYFEKRAISCQARAVADVQAKNNSRMEGSDQR